jgi:hypothetical protein
VFSNGLLGVEKEAVAEKRACAPGKRGIIMLTYHSSTTMQRLQVRHAWEGVCVHVAPHVME